MYIEIDIYDYMNDILKALRNGVLITTKKNNRINSMTISWGQVGIEWNKTIFTSYIRKSRYTHDLLESGEFSINIPMNQSVAEILTFCGTKSGRNVDKIKELGLTLIDGKEISVPGIKELPLTLECKIIYKQDQDKTLISEDIKENFYQEGILGGLKSANEIYHTMFYGEIVSSYIIK